MAKEIKLTKGKVAIVDNVDYEWLNQWKWYAQEAKKTYYAVRTIKLEGKKKNIYMHILIMNPPIETEPDHKNRNGLDNQRHNLRIATHSQNMINTRIWKTNTSGCKGVSWHKAAGKWRVRIVVNYKEIHLGLFDQFELAIKARKKAEKKYFGEFLSL